MKAEREQWRAIPSSTNYEVSNLGRVRRKDTRVIVSTNISERGTVTCNIRINGIQTTAAVSRLVGEAWCKKFQKHLRVRYVNGDFLDCRPANLEWITVSQKYKEVHAKRS